MIQALLIDLDDTLLENDVARFLPAYFDLLAGALSAFAPKDQAMAALLAGTKAMLANEDPQRTLAQVFYESFGAATGASRAAMASVLDRFYRESYPKLAGLTRPKDGAQELLRLAAERGLAIAVSTNPLMIHSAIEQRLDWAGVPVTAFDYALLTDVEMFHFAKPRPAYFAETLAHLGRLPTEAVMIGNDASEDLDPAATLGLPVFHVATAPADGRPSGDLRQAAAWLSEQTSQEPAPTHLPEALIARFEAQLAALLSRLDRLSPAGLRETSEGGGLAPLQVVCHLRDVDREVNLPRLRTFLTEADPFFSSVDTDHWIIERDYLKEDPSEAIRGLVAARKEVTQSLRQLSPAEWSRRGRHSLLGPITLAEWTAVLVEHDLRHQAQVVVPGSGRYEGGIHDPGRQENRSAGR